MPSTPDHESTGSNGSRLDRPAIDGSPNHALLVDFDSKIIFETMCRALIFSSWFKPDGNFVRSNLSQLDSKTSKTLGGLMGRCLKKLILEGSCENWVELFLSECAVKRVFQLYLY